MEPTPTTQQTAKPKDKALEIIRSELNLEQWAVWQPSKSKNPLKSRILQREIVLPDGNKVVAKVEIAPTTRGALTTEDQRTLYALIKHWEEKGRPDSLTPFSLKGLARLLKKQWGTNVIQSLTESLIRLRVTAFIWENSYYDKTAGETVEVLDPFNILSDLKILKRRQDGHITKEAGYYRFNELVLANLKNHYTKPVIYETAISFQSEIAQLIYGRIDRLLFDKTQYERRTKELFDDLGLEGKTYGQRSERKRALEPALKELAGKPLTTGIIATAKLEPTADGKDFKVVFRKGARAPYLRALPTPPEQSRGEQQSTSPQSNANNQASQQAIDLVKYFHNRFFGADNILITPNSKPAGQAAQLIARHGFEQAKYIVDFAHRAAKETNFQIQTFGGILQYEVRAIGEYEDHQRRQVRQAQQQAEAVERDRLEREHANYCRQAIDAYIAEHAADLPARIEAKKKEFLAQRYDLYSQWPDDTFTDFAQRAIRSDIFIELGLPNFGDYCDQQSTLAVTEQGTTESPNPEDLPILTV